MTTRKNNQNSELVYSTITGDKSKRRRRVTDADKPDAVKIRAIRTKKAAISRHGDGKKKPVLVLVPKISNFPVDPRIIEKLTEMKVDPRYVDIVSYTEVIIRNHQIPIGEGN